MTASVFRIGCVVVLLVTAGCLGNIGDFVSGDESLSYTAGSVHVADDAVSASPFSQEADKAVSFNRSIEVQGESRTVEMNAHMVQLKRSYQGAPLGSLVILSLPQVEVLGQQVDVMEQVDPASMVSDARGSSADLQQDQQVGTRSVRILGENRSVEVFSGTATSGDQSGDARVYVATFKHQGDTVVAFGVVPQIESSDEGAVLDLFEAIQYEG